MGRFRNALNALLRHDLPSGDALDALARRVAVLEAQSADLLSVVEAEADRAARWVDMNAQLRRFLGRLDAHAGAERRKAEEEEPANGTRTDPKQLAAILRSKFPNSGV